MTILMCVSFVMGFFTIPIWNHCFFDIVPKRHVAYAWAPFLVALFFVVFTIGTSSDHLETLKISGIWFSVGFIVFRILKRLCRFLVSWLESKAFFGHFPYGSD